MRIATLLTMLAVSCGGTAQPAATTTPPKLLHSPELNDIMKAEVNQPFSALQFLVFHAGDANPGGSDLDYARIAVPASTLREGIFKVRAIVDPPVPAGEARAVFFTYVDSLARDSEQLFGAVALRDRGKTERLLTRIGETCSNCHHFFRLKDIEEIRR
jgi:cytochrome c556